MLVAAAVCPHPPLLVSGVGAGASGELDGLRAACDAAVATLLAARPTLVVVVGAAPADGPFPEGAWGNLRPYGVGSPGEGVPGEGVLVASRAAPATLPLAFTLGRWLLDRAGVDHAGVDHAGVDHAGVDPLVLLFGVAADAGPDRCLAFGEALANRADRVALLAMGDGSARRSPKGPGGLHADAAAFDTAVEQALRDADAPTLAAIGPRRASDLLVAGRPAWQVMAGAALAAVTDWRGDVHWAGSPYGVTYLVATWVPAG